MVTNLQTYHSFQARVRPHAYGIGGIAVGGEQFLAMGRKVQARDLGRRSLRVQTSAGSAVPYVDSSVVCAPAGREQVGLPRRPRQSLNFFFTEQW